MPGVAGVLLTRNEASVLYNQSRDAENRLKVVTNTLTREVTKFIYDGDGARVLDSSGWISQGQYSYNAIGNITNTSRLGNYVYTVTVASCVAGTPSTKPHAVSRAGSNAYTYDCNGNMLTRIEVSGTQRITYTQSWDRENRLLVVTNTASVPNAVTRFVYDGDGARVLQIQISGTQVMTTAYASALEVQITSTQRITKTYYSAGSQLIAMRVFTSPTSSVLYYLHGDHLGSTSLTTDQNGNVVARQLYDAWGNVRLRGDLKTDITFTGQRSSLDQIGLYYFKARYYASYLNRWLSPDTIVPRASDPQQLNRYAYGLNNPVKYIDPSGHAAICGTTAEGCERSWFQPNTQPHPPEAMNNAWNFATSLIVTVVSIPFEAVDYVATGVQCATSGCTAAEVAITLIPGAIGPVAKGVGKIVGLVDDVPVGAVDEVVESLTDAGKAAENAAENGGSAATALHKNALDYVGDTHVYRIKGPDGSTYKIGQSAQGVRKADGASIRAEQQVRRLTRENGPGYSSQIRRRFPDKRSAYEYENRLIERFRRTYGEDSLPGNLNNH